MDLRDEIARIDQRQAETRRFAAEMHQLTTSFLSRPRSSAFHIWPLAASGVIVSIGLIGFGAALGRVFC